MEDFVVVQITETEVNFMEDCAVVADFSAAMVAVVAAAAATATTAADFTVAAQGLGAGGGTDFIAFIVDETREALLLAVFIVDNDNRRYGVERHQSGH